MWNPGGFPESKSVLESVFKAKKWLMSWECWWHFPGHVSSDARRNRMGRHSAVDRRRHGVQDFRVLPHFRTLSVLVCPGLHQHRQASHLQPYILLNRIQSNVIHSDIQRTSLTRFGKSNRYFDGRWLSNPTGIHHWIYFQLEPVLC